MQTSVGLYRRVYYPTTTTTIITMTQNQSTAECQQVSKQTQLCFWLHERKIYGIAITIGWADGRRR